MSYKVYPGDANTPVILAERLTLIQRQPSPLGQNLTLIQL